MASLTTGTLFCLVALYLTTGITKTLGQDQQTQNLTDTLTRMRYDNSFNDPNNASLYLNTELLSVPRVTANQTRGRALDLEALLGEPSHPKPDSGHRESRIINEKPGLAVQSFIPIVTLANNQPKKQDTHLGHQSFVPHYEQQQPQYPQHHQPQPHYETFSEEPKYIGGALQGLASALRPKRKGSFGQPEGVFGQDCLCVPFYMCKNGYLESTAKNNLAGQQQPQHDKNTLEAHYAAAESEAQKNFAQIPPQLNSYYQQQQQNQRPTDQYQPSSSHDAPNIQYDPANLPLDERSIDGHARSTSNNDTANNNQAVADIAAVLGRNLGGAGFGGGFGSFATRMLGAPQSCGVLRTCCRVLPDISVVPQGSEVHPQQPYPGHIPQPSPFQPPHHQLPAQNHLPFLRPPFRKPMNPFQGLPGLPGTFEITGASLFKPKPLPIQRPVGPFVTPLPQFLGNNFQPKPFQKPSGLLPHIGQLPPMPRPVNPLGLPGLRPQPRPLPLPITPGSPYPAPSFISPSNHLSPVRPSYGTCGARNAIGIHGRVQNLQYHEASAEFGEYPWQVALLKRIGPQDSLYVCGATMITSEWVLTAAHCIKKNTAADLKVRFGEWDVHRDDEFYPYVEKFVKDIIVHPEFFPGNLVNDIALIRVDSPVDLHNPHIAPVCLPEPFDNFEGQRCWVTGWGKDSFGHQGEYQSVLKEVDLPVVGHGQCEHALRQTRLGHYYQLHPGFMCAGGEQGKDACEGDGGSPLVCEVGGVWKVAGIVSWGIGCGQAGVPGVYASIGYYRNWIDDVISKFGPYTPGGVLISERSNSGNDTLVRDEPLTPKASSLSLSDKKDQDGKTDTTTTTAKDDLL